MKKIKVLLLIGIFAGFYSCDENEAPLYTGGGEALLSFVEDEVDLEIVIDSNGERTVQVAASSLSDSDRTFSLMVNEEDTDAPTGSFSVPASVTIPANSYFGEFVISGTDVNVETEPTTLTVSFGNDVVSSGDLQVNVFQVCPIPDGYLTGQYQLTNLTNTLGLADFQDGVVEITAPSTFRRTFMNTVSAFNASSAPVPVSFDLVCNEIIVRPFMSNISLSCAAGEEPLSFGPSPNRTQYDATVPGSDEVIQLIYQGNVGGTCGGSPNNNAVVLLTKI